MSIKAAEGRNAEKYFLCAMVKLGYELVIETNPFRPRTIRQATYQEDNFAKIDFVLTLARDKNGQARPVIPLQLTLAKRSGVGEKRARAERGEVAFFWPVREWGQQASLEILQKAAREDSAALKQFGEFLESVCEDFLERRAQCGSSPVVMSRLTEPAPPIRTTAEHGTSKKRSKCAIIDVADGFELVRPRGQKKCPVVGHDHTGIIFHILRRAGYGDPLARWFKCPSLESRIPQTVAEALALKPQLAAA